MHCTLWIFRCLSMPAILIALPTNVIRFREIVSHSHRLILSDCISRTRIFLDHHVLPSNRISHSNWDAAQQIAQHNRKLPLFATIAYELKTQANYRSTTLYDFNIRRNAHARRTQEQWRTTDAVATAAVVVVIYVPYSMSALEDIYSNAVVGNTHHVARPSKDDGDHAQYSPLFLTSSVHFPFEASLLFVAINIPLTLPRTRSLRHSAQRTRPTKMVHNWTVICSDAAACAHPSIEFPHLSSENCLPKCQQLGNSSDMNIVELQNNSTIVLLLL